MARRMRLSYARAVAHKRSCIVDSLLKMNRTIGEEFGTDHLSLFLYSLIRMNRPTNIVELGTGFGLTAFWMAYAAKLNRSGHVWTVDDFEMLRRRNFRAIVLRLRQAGFKKLHHADPAAYFQSMCTSLGLGNHVTQVPRRIDLSDVSHFQAYPFVQQPIDLLFSDFQADPESVLRLLGHFLPRMAQASSIFIDSAAGWWPSYLLLEMTVNQLNQGQIPDTLTRWGFDLTRTMSNRRLTLIHLTKPARTTQNATSWLKIEPLDVMPHPLTAMHGRGADDAASRVLS